MSLGLIYIYYIKTMEVYIMGKEKFIKGQYAIIVGPVNRQKIMAVLLLKKSKLSNKWKVFSRLYNEEFWVKMKRKKILTRTSAG